MIGIPIERQNSLRLSITDALKRAGWTMKQIKVYGKLNRVWLEPERQVSANSRSVPDDRTSTNWANP